MFATAGTLRITLAVRVCTMWCDDLAGGWFVSESPFTIANLVQA
jgi:hypothetical protein